MAIAGLGHDLVEVAAFTALLDEPGTVFAQHVFTEGERQAAVQRAARGSGRPAVHLAARFAAKEAVGKALGIGMTRWHEVEVVRGRGAPTAILAGRCLRRAGDLGVVEVMLSLTHSRGMAAAVAILRGA